LWKLQISANLKPLPSLLLLLFLLPFYFWQYYPTSILVFCTRLFQAFLYLTSWLQFFSFSFFKSFITSSLHLFFGRPLFLIPLKLNQWKWKLIYFVLSQERCLNIQKTDMGKAHQNIMMLRKYAGNREGWIFCLIYNLFRFLCRGLQI